MFLFMIYKDLLVKVYLYNCISYKTIKKCILIQPLEEKDE